MNCLRCEGDLTEDQLLLLRPADVIVREIDDGLELEVPKERVFQHWTVRRSWLDDGGFEGDEAFKDDNAIEIVHWVPTRRTPDGIPQEGWIVTEKDWRSDPTEILAQHIGVRIPEEFAPLLQLPEPSVSGVDPNH